MDGTNLYAYVNDMPTRAVDPTGEILCDDLQRWVYWKNSAVMTTWYGGLDRVKKKAIADAKDQIRDWRDDMWRWCDERNSKCTLANVFVGDGGYKRCVGVLYDCFIVIGAVPNGSKIGDGFDYRYYLQCQARCQTDLVFPGRTPPDVGLDLIGVARQRHPALMAVAAVATLIKWATYVLQD